MLVLLIAGAATLASRDFRARQGLSWVRSGQLGLASLLQGEQRVEVLGENVLRFLAEYLDAQVGAVYVREGGDTYRHVASHAVVPFTAPARVRVGEGLLGQSARTGELLRVDSIPQGYLSVGSALGGAEPRELLIVPAKADGEVQAVFELAFFRELEEVDLQMLSLSSEALGIAIRSARDRTKLETLLEETQRQGEELQTQQEELRVSNEELEEQSRALMDSKQRLESQQEELEQTNSQLSDQASALSRQKEALQKAQVVLSEKAAELERTNQYKSEFLANMSHELRTPLNSALILAKLLADNKHGNLTAEQVRFADTISGAGNDLLALINDVLDLSKIEAGKIELEPRSVALAPLVEGVIRSLRMDAKQKNLELQVEVDPTTPEQIVTDPGRLTQILRNLLSNALKFTDQGSVRLYLHAPRPGEVSLAVVDTGIGIAAHQHEIIFEAFRQADGSTHRKHGGTGLGLSISRDLARLLGGDLTVASEPGKGSTFTLLLPAVFAPAIPVPVDPPTLAARPERAENEPVRRRPAPVPLLKPQTAAATPSPELALADDRANLVREARSILVIEDDPRFALILRDLAREMHFQCIVCFTGKEGLELAARYLPSAILLDINLPDQSGLSVLDQLKGDSGTRHIPVHVVSVMDYTHHAMERGAVGYAMKPVKREELISALQKLEARLSQTVRRVLVVEDDERQRESMQALLGNPEVEIIGVATAAQAFEQLQSKTFDCMVLDLTLPDTSGTELLERMSARDDLSFPPVIIYTGQRLTRQQEEELQRYSRSIILKDARSPERLLDEVTLFLHQVEDRLLPEQRRLLQTGRDRDASLDGRRVLIVEDDVRNIFALTSLLEPRGIKTSIARNGLEAIAALESSQQSTDTPIDLVLMDIMMPQMDGLDRHAAHPPAARVPQAAHHCAHGQGHARRPAQVPRGRRERLHGQASRCGQAVLADTRVDAASLRHKGEPRRKKPE